MKYPRFIAVAALLAAALAPTTSRADPDFTVDFAQNNWLISVHMNWSGLPNDTTYFFIFDELHNTVYQEGNLAGLPSSSFSWYDDVIGLYPDNYLAAGTHTLTAAYRTDQGTQYDESLMTYFGDQQYTIYTIEQPVGDPPTNSVPDSASTVGLVAAALGLVAAFRRRLQGA